LIVLSGELVLEEAIDLSQDRLLNKMNEWMNEWVSSRFWELHELLPFFMIDCYTIAWWRPGFV
jgi:hypothetical protein